MFFTPPSPVDTVLEATVSEVKASLPRTIEDASRGIETRVTKHKRTVAFIVSPAAHIALRRYRDGVRLAFESAFRRIARIRSQPERGLAPSDSKVADLMDDILRQLQGVLEVGPDRTVQTSDGGIDTYFFSAEKLDDGSSARTVCLGVDSDGDAFILFSTGEEDAAEDLIPESNPEELAARITDFLGGVERTETPSARAGPAD